MNKLMGAEYVMAWTFAIEIAVLTFALVSTMLVALID
jgi:hypothetical protein